jgi:hypothetical protein
MKFVHAELFVCCTGRFSTFFSLLFLWHFEEMAVQVVDESTDRPQAVGPDHDTIGRAPRIEVEPRGEGFATYRLGWSWGQPLSQSTLAAVPLTAVSQAQRRRFGVAL